MSPIEQLLRNKLQPLNPSHFELLDESHRHLGHAGSKQGGHYKLTLVSNAFTGQTSITRHRKVLSLIDDLMHTHIHALSIKTLAPEEYN